MPSRVLKALEHLTYASASDTSAVSEAVSALKSVSLDATEQAFVEEFLVALASPERPFDPIDRLPWTLQRDIVDPVDVALNARLRTAPAVERVWPEFPVHLPMLSAITGTPVVVGRIGTCQVAFWLDTGSSGSVISNETARRCAIEPLAGSATSTGGASGQAFEVAPAVIPSIAFGEISLLNERMAIIPAEALTLGDEAIQGIIGWPVLRERRLDFDFDAGCLTIAPPASLVTRPNLFWLGYPLVVFGSEGALAVFGLDTGAGATRATSSGLELTEGQRWITSFEIGGVGGTRSIRSEMAERIELSAPMGNVTITNIKTSPGAFGTVVPLDGRMGIDVLRSGGRAIVDYMAGEMVLGNSSSTGCSEQGSK